ncbi:MAG: acireductone synthase [Thermodesulfobacteriota bacterium]
MVKAVLLDIEGTTTSLAFVKEVLFPYAHRCLPAFLAQHHAEPAVAEQLQQVRQIAGQDLTVEDIGAVLRTWIAQDLKIAPLKNLQAMLWQRGYKSGAIKGHVYSDAVIAMKKWQRAGRSLYVYSSGSVQAQKLLFKHSGHGDLTSLFSGHFDLKTGGKKDAASYAEIARAVGLPPREIVFLSDAEDELDAARRAGMRTVWVVREGRLPAPGGHITARAFDSIKLS